MASDITDLREYLFDAIESLKDGKIDVEQARAIANLASEISKTAKLQIDFCKATGKKQVLFIEQGQ